MLKWTLKLHRTVVANVLAVTFEAHQVKGNIYNEEPSARVCFPPAPSGHKVLVQLA